MKSSRRGFLKQSALIGAGGLLFQNLFAEKAMAAATPLTSPQRKRILRVAHLTDIHVKPELVSETGFSKALHAVNDLKDKPDFIINGGDAIMNSVLATKDLVKKQWHSFHTILNNENSLPIHHCIGNHDVFGWLTPSITNDKGKNWAKDELGLNQSYYALNKGNWKIIVLDSIHPRNTIPGYVAKLDEAQMDWLKNELSISTHQFICIVSHIPILSICSFFDGSTPHHNRMNVSDNCMHSDATFLKNLFYQYPNIKTCLSGHIHLVDQLEYLGINYYCNGAVCGSWWEGNYKEFAPAFAIMNLYNDGTTERELHYYDWK